ncbi:MAG: class F sortase [Nitriliruptorales bacterium]
MTETLAAYARRAALILAAAMVVVAAAVFLASAADTPAGHAQPTGQIAPTAPATAPGQAIPAPRPVVAPEPPRPVVAPDRVRIAAIGVNAPLIPLGLNPDRTLAVPTTAGIAGWYTGAPTPGEVGPAIVVGHVDWRGEHGVFKRLDQLRPGDQVEFRSGDDVTSTFVVTRSERVSKEAFPTQRVYGDTAGPELRLITCGGVFDRTSGHYRDNVIVYAKAVGETNR